MTLIGHGPDGTRVRLEVRVDALEIYGFQVPRGGRAAMSQFRMSGHVVRGIAWRPITRRTFSGVKFNPSFRAPFKVICP